MGKISMKELLERANNKGYFIHFKLGTMFGSPCLIVKVRIESEPRVMFADGKPFRSQGDYTHRIEKTIHYLAEIPDCPDAFVDVLMQNKLLRELMEE